MRLSEANRLMDYWAEECPPPHISLMQIFIGLGGKAPGTKKDAPAKDMSFEEFAALVGVNSEGAKHGG
jgi:hypothetical protein